eukprot:CAMPEP_0194528400 /NCGR_PEP_ID=MMETSP0253-20130528/64787_1 /TAXON_ID=2966 /ORGANISM="Noctiluca scintillans" /LENGTH=182 /DNA_ID=CAMNT_0039373445 /DNA_START=351 /DNA_END=897 /DNA_ORIENTATION=-
MTVSFNVFARSSATRSPSHFTSIMVADDFHWQHASVLRALCAVPRNVVESLAAGQQEMRHTHSETDRSDRAGSISHDPEPPPAPYIWPLSEPLAILRHLWQRIPQRQPASLQLSLAPSALAGKGLIVAVSWLAWGQRARKVQQQEKEPAFQRPNASPHGHPIQTVRRRSGQTHRTSSFFAVW